MKIEINKEILNKWFKSDKIKKIISKGNINKSYYVLLIFMVGLASISIYTNLNNNYENLLLQSEVATVFSNSEESLKSEEHITDNNELTQIIGEIHYFTDKSNILNSEYTDGIAKFEIDGKKEIYSIFDGVVENIYIDYCYGYTVVVTNEKNIRIKYCNLDSNIKLNIGDNIKKGNVIGTSIQHSLIDSRYIYIMMYYKNENINIINLFEI